MTQETGEARRFQSLRDSRRVVRQEANIEQHQAVLNAAQINLDYTNIVSPVNGTVVSRNVTMGQTVAASFQTPTLFLIATDLTRMQVDANVSESDIGGIQASATRRRSRSKRSRITCSRGRSSQVRQAPQTVQNVVTYDVVVSVANPESAAQAGDDRDDPHHRRPPRQRGPGAGPGAALRAGGASPRARRGCARHVGQAVWVLRDGQPIEVGVTVGLDDDTYAEVVQGELQAGDQVVTSEQTSGGRLIVGASAVLPTLSTSRQR